MTHPNSDLFRGSHTWVCLFAIGLMLHLSLPTILANERDDEVVRKLYGKAQKELLSGDPEAALSRFQAIIARYPATPWAAQSLWELYRIHDHFGNAEPAFAALEVLIVKHPGHFEKAHMEQFRLVQRLLDRGENAKRTLERARPAEKVDSEVLSAMLQSIRRHGPHAEPGVLAHYHLAIVTEKQGKKDEAIALYDEFTETHPQHELTDDAAYQRAYLTYKKWVAGQNAGPRLRDLATMALVDFLARYPQSDKCAQARGCLQEAAMAEFKELRSLARYYRSRGNEKAASVYYDQLATKFPAAVVKDEWLASEIMGSGKDSADGAKAGSR